MTAPLVDRLAEMVEEMAALDSKDLPDRARALLAEWREGKEAERKDRDARRWCSNPDHLYACQCDDPEAPAPPEPKEE